MGPTFSSFSSLGVCLGEVWKKSPKRSETRPSKTLKIVFPCTREHSFHFRSATRKWCSFSPFVVIVGHLAVFYGDFRCFCVCVFSGPDLWVHSEIRGSPGWYWGCPGVGFRVGKPLPQRGLREPFHNSARLMAQGPPDIYIYIYIKIICWIKSELT